MNKILKWALLLIVSMKLNAQTVNDGLKAMDYEKYNQASGIFSQLIANEPVKGDYYFYLGECKLNLGDAIGAKESFTNGIKADANNPTNYIGMGELLLSQNKVDEAKTNFTKAMSFSKGKDGVVKDALTLSMVAWAMVSTEHKLADDALKLVNDAIEITKKNYDVLILCGDVLLERNEGGPAANYYEKAIDLDKFNPKAFVRVAQIWLRVRNDEATNTSLNDALALDSNYAPALKTLAEYYILTKKYDKAKETYLHYLRFTEETPAKLTRLVQILFNLKEYENVLNKVEEVQKTDMNNPYMFRMKGYSCYEVGEAKKDTSKFRPGVAAMETFFTKIEPSKIIISDYEYYGKLLSRIPGRENEALDNFNKVLNLDTAKIEVYPEMAKLNNKLKRFDSSIVNYENYINKKRNPNVADFYFMSNYYLFGKQYGKADTAAMKVIELKPDYALAYFMRAKCNLYIDPDQNTFSAKEFYEKFIPLAEANTDKNKNNLIIAYFYFATYWIKQDDNIKAKEYLNKILSLDPEYKEAKDYLKQLK